MGSLKKYESVQDIIRDFFELRMKYYVLRKDWLAGMLGAESAKLSNQARFILEKIQGTLVIGKCEVSNRFCVVVYLFVFQAHFSITVENPVYLLI